MIRIACALGLILTSCAAYSADYEGHWRVDKPCEYEGNGSHFSYTLKKDRPGRYSGTWEESTNDRGWAGQVKGVVRGNTISLSRCIDSDSSSWTVDENEICPNYKIVEVYKLRRDRLISLTTGMALGKSKIPEGKKLESAYSCVTE